MGTLEIMSACVEGTTQALIKFINLEPYVICIRENKVVCKINLDRMIEVLNFSKQALTYRNINNRIYQEHGVIIQKKVLGLDTTKTILYLPPEELKTFKLERKTLSQAKLDRLSKHGYTKLCINTTKVDCLIDELASYRR